MLDSYFFENKKKSKEIKCGKEEKKNYIRHIKHNTIILRFKFDHHRVKKSSILIITTVT